MADEVSPQPTLTPAPKKSGMNKGLVITAIIIVILILAGGFFLFTKMKSSSTSSNSTTSSNVPTDAPATQPPMVEYKYICANKKTMDVKYDNIAHSAQITLSDGKSMNLTQTPSGSGVQYSDSAKTIILYTQGGSAFLTENGKKTYESCSSGS